MEEQNVQLTNPARRLHDFLVRARTLEGKKQTHQMLAKWFDVKEGDMAEIFTMFSAFLRLIEDTERQLNNIEDPNKERFLKCMPPIRSTYAKINLDHPWNQYANKPTDSDLALLELAGQALDRYKREALIPGNQLNDIRQEATDLFDRVAQSDLDPNLRVVILDLLETILRCLSEYKIRGAEGLKRAVAESIGRLTLEKELVLQEKDNDTFKAFWDLLAKLNLAVSSAIYANALGEGIAKVMDKLLK
jgi:hypothetical protein